MICSSDKHCNLILFTEGIQIDDMEYVMTKWVVTFQTFASLHGG